MPADLKSQLASALLSAWEYILYLAPYVAGGILLAALLNTFVSRRKLVKVLQVRRWWVLPAAAAAGAVSPACTYGTVPLFMEMIKGGAPMAPAAAFLVASSLVNPQMFLITAGALGMGVAVVQAVVCTLFSVFAGMAVSAASRRGVDLESNELKSARKNEEQRESEDMRAHHAKHATMRRAGWPKRLALNVLDLTEFIGFYFVLGAVVAGLAAQFIPRGMVISAVGEGKWWAVPFAAVVSIPTYICGGGSIPLVAAARDMGMAMGAVLAFLIAGPATRVTALSALAVLFRKRVVLVYAIIVLIFASLMGVLLGEIVPAAPPPVPPVD